MGVMIKNKNACGLFVFYLKWTMDVMKKTCDVFGVVIDSIVLCAIGSHCLSVRLCVLSVRLFL